MKRRRHLYEFLSLSFALLLGCTHAWTSINRGSIRGTVTDPQGAAVPRAVISVTNADTGVQQTTQTLESQLNSSLDQWDGQAKEAYAVARAKWQAAEANMAAVLNNLRTVAGEANVNYQATEASNAGLWG